MHGGDGDAEDEGNSGGDRDGVDSGGDEHSGDEGNVRDSGDGRDERDAGADRSGSATAHEVLLELPESARDRFKEPFGPVYDDASALLADAGRPIVAVGDVVTYHLEAAGHRPAVAFVDGRTERERAPEAVRDVVDGRTDEIAVRNPAGTVTRGLLAATRDALAAERPTTVVVDGEEDLAAVPAVLAAPDGAAVVYGQPGEGMVLVDVTDEHREAFRDLLAAFDGDRDAATDVLEA